MTNTNLLHTLVNGDELIRRLASVVTPAAGPASGETRQTELYGSWPYQRRANRRSSTQPKRRGPFLNLLVAAPAAHPSRELCAAAWGAHPA